MHCPFKPKTSKRKKLKWTGTQVDFVELLYALHEAGVFDNVSLKDLFNTIREIVDCEVKNHYRIFWNIKSRSADERPFFLNKLTKKFSDKLVRMDGGARS